MNACKSRAGGQICMVALLLLSAGGVLADTLTLGGGDALSGKLVMIADGILLFRTNLAGQMLVPTEEIASLSTSRNLRVSFGNEEEIVGRLVSAEGVTQLLMADGRRHAVSLTDIACAIPMAGPEDGKSRLDGAEVPDAQLHGTLETGVSSRLGSNDYADLYSRLTLSWDTDRYALSASMMVERADADVFPRLLAAEALLRVSPGQGPYPVFGLDVARDTAEALAFRGSMFVGVGSGSADSGPRKPEASAGVGVTFEEFDAKRRWRHTPRYWLEDSRKSNVELDLHLKLRHDLTIFKTAQFAQTLAIYPSLIRFGDFRARSESAFLYPLKSRIRLKLNILVAYDNEPAFDDLEQWRAAVGASLLWDF